MTQTLVALTNKLQFYVISSLRLIIWGVASSGSPIIRSNNIAVQMFEVQIWKTMKTFIAIP